MGLDQLNFSPVIDLNKLEEGTEVSVHFNASEAVLLEMLVKKSRDQSLTVQRPRGSKIT
jgi:hypothetical protein